MTQQLPLGGEARAAESPTDDNTHQIAPDLAYQRLIFVNVVFYGKPGAGDRSWVLIDTGGGRNQGLDQAGGGGAFW